MPAYKNKDDESFLDTAGDSVLGLIQGVTLGAGDELAGVGGGLAGLLTDEGFSKGYKSSRDFSRKMNNKAQARSPKSYVAADVLGSIVPGIITGGAGFGPAATGAVVGGASGFGHSNAKSKTGLILDTLLGATAGGVAGKATSALGSSLSKSAPSWSKPATELPYWKGVPIPGIPTPKAPIVDAADATAALLGVLGARNLQGAALGLARPALKATGRFMDAVAEPVLSGARKVTPEILKEALNNRLVQGAVGAAAGTSAADYLRPPPRAEKLLDRSLQIASEFAPEVKEMSKEQRDFNNRLAKEVEKKQPVSEWPKDEEPAGEWPTE
jgi:hypothetical protein